MKQEIVSILVLVSIALLSPACSKHDGGTPSGASTVSSKDDGHGKNDVGEGTWETSSKEAPDHSVSLSISQMPKDQIDSARQSYKQTDLIPVPVDTSYQVNLFKIKTHPEYENTVFIAPKLYSYGSDDGGIVLPDLNEDGSVTLTFRVILTPGTSPEITSVDGKTRIPLPDTIMIKDLNQLKVDLTARFGTNQTLATLPGCPHTFSLSANGKQWDASNIDAKGADFCQVDYPFSVSVRLPAQDAMQILEQDLYEHTVSLSAVYDTEVAFTTSRVQISFNKQRLFEALAAELRVNASFYAEVDVKTTLQRVIQKQAMKVYVQGDFNSHLDEIVQRAQDLFFTKFIPDPDSGIKECDGTQIACLHLNYSYSNDTEDLAFNWDQSSTALTDVSFVTWTELQPMGDKTVRLGHGTPLSNLDFLNHVGTPGIETGLTVVPDALVTITPEQLIVETREINQPTSETTRNNVCIADHEVCVRYNNQEPVTSPEMCGVNESETGHLLCPPMGEPAQRCLQKGRVCDSSQDQWVTTTKYALGQPKFVPQDLPIGTVKKIFDGLALKFVWRNLDGSPSEVTCPLNSFPDHGDGKSLQIKVNNTPGCQVFTPGQSSSPMITLINEIDFPLSYYSTDEVSRWDGFHQMPETAVYHPNVQFVGTVTVRDYQFDSVLGGIGKLSRNLHE